MGRIKYFLKDLMSFFKPQIKVEFEGLLISGRSYDYGFLKALKNESREPYMFSLFKENIQTGKDVLDIGAHLGHYTLIAAKKLSANGRVLAFEADPATYEVLIKNIRQNEFTRPPSAHHVALSDKTGTVVFCRDVYQPDFSSMSAQRANSVLEKVEVKSFALDDFVSSDLAPRDLNIGLIKIDIEGAEIQALKGASKVIQKFKPTLFVESNPAALKQFNSRPLDLVQLLTSYGYSVFVIQEEKKQLVPVGEIDLTDEVHNLICKP